MTERFYFQLYYSNYINFLYKFFKSNLCLC